MNSWIINSAIRAIERGWVPDALTASIVRELCRRRLSRLKARSNGQGSGSESFLRSLSEAPIAMVPELANAQHYEVSPQFFRLWLGPRLKYSCCYWPDTETTLAQAEAISLRLTCEHAELSDGMSVLDLGCGWGALTLWIAEHFPNCRVTAISNSSGQTRWIQDLARHRGYADRVEVIRADMNHLELGRRFDRIISVEMFEHLRNVGRALAQVAQLLTDQGRVLVHVFCHRHQAYAFDERGPTNWMGRYFFSGGMMPCQGYLRFFDADLTVQRNWIWNGTHYARTLQAWLQQLDHHAGEARSELRKSQHPREAQLMLNRWRLFLIACRELFAYREGQEWFVEHTLLERRHS